MLGKTERRVGQQQHKLPLRPDSKLPGLRSFQHPAMTQIMSVPKGFSCIGIIGFKELRTQVPLRTWTVLNI